MAAARPQTPRIRRASPDDSSQLAPLFVEWGHAMSVDEIRTQLELWQRTPAAVVLVAETMGEVVGFVGVACLPNLGRAGRSARVMGLGVASGSRRRGIASALVRAAEDHARDWSADQVHVPSGCHRVAAHQLYEALGYGDSCARQAHFVRQL